MTRNYYHTQGHDLAIAEITDTDYDILIRVRRRLFGKDTPSLLNYMDAEEDDMFVAPRSMTKFRIGYHTLVRPNMGLHLYSIY